MLMKFGTEEQKASLLSLIVFFFFQAEDGIRDGTVTGVQTCALPISAGPRTRRDAVARADGAAQAAQQGGRQERAEARHGAPRAGLSRQFEAVASTRSQTASIRRANRSEERRVGKECGTWWSPAPSKK